MYNHRMQRHPLLLEALIISFLLVSLVWQPAVADRSITQEAEGLGFEKTAPALHHVGGFLLQQGSSVQTTDVPTPEVPFGCVGFGQCPTVVPLRERQNVTPALKITAITLADQLTDFARIQMPTELRPNTLWVEVTNVGAGAFNPPGGMGQYILQVLLKGPHELLEEYTFAPGQPFELEPLQSMPPGGVQHLRINSLFFFTPVQDGELEVFIRPERSLGLANSILSRPITVNKHGDSYLNCAATVAQAILKVVGLRFPPAALQGRIGLDVSRLGLGLAKCHDGGCIAKEGGTWLAVMVVKYLVDADAGQAISLISDASKELGQTNIPCLKVSDLVNAYLNQLLLSGRQVNGLTTGASAYPIVVDAAGRSAGFGPGGQIMLEIPGAQVVAVGDECILLYPGQDLVQVEFTGVTDDSVDVGAILADGQSNGKQLVFKKVPFTAHTVARLSAAAPTPSLQIIESGVVASTLLPSVSDRVGEHLANMESSSTPGAVAPTATSASAGTPIAVATPTQAPSSAKGSSGPCRGVLGVAILPAVGLLLAARRRRN